MYAASSPAPQSGRATARIRIITRDRTDPTSRPLVYHGSLSRRAYALGCTPRSRSHSAARCNTASPLSLSRSGEPTRFASRSELSTALSNRCCRLSSSSAQMLIVDAAFRAVCDKSSWTVSSGPFRSLTQFSISPTNEEGRLLTIAIRPAIVSPRIHWKQPRGYTILPKACNDIYQQYAGKYPDAYIGASLLRNELPVQRVASHYFPILGDLISADLPKHNHQIGMQVSHRLNVSRGCLGKSGSLEHDAQSAEQCQAQCSTHGGRVAAGILERFNDHVEGYPDLRQIFVESAGQCLDSPLGSTTGFVSADGLPSSPRQSLTNGTLFEAAAAALNVRPGGDAAENKSKRRSPQMGRPIMIGPGMLGRAVAVQVSMAADVERSDDTKQQDQSEGHGIRIPARPVNADTAQHEARRESEWNECFVRHRAGRLASRLIMRSAESTITARLYQTRRRACAGQLASRTTARLDQAPRRRVRAEGFAGGLAATAPSTAKPTVRSGKPPLLAVSTLPTSLPPQRWRPDVITYSFKKRFKSQTFEMVINRYSMQPSRLIRYEQSLSNLFQLIDSVGDLLRTSGSLKHGPQLVRGGRQKWQNHVNRAPEGSIFHFLRPYIQMVYGYHQLPMTFFSDFERGVVLNTNNLLHSNTASAKSNLTIEAHCFLRAVKNFLIWSTSTERASAVGTDFQTSEVGGIV